MSNSSGAGRPRRIVFVLYCLFCALVCLTAVECVARFFEAFGPRTFVFKRFDDTLGLSLIPNSSGAHRSCFDGFVSINRYGMRDAPRELEKRVGTYRIGVFGDSVVEGLHVHPNQVATRRLETLLNRGPCAGRCEVLNFGVGGFGTLQELLHYQRDGKQFGLDLIVVVFVGNDLENNLPGSEYDGNLYSAPNLELKDDGDAVLHRPHKPLLYEPLFLLNSESAAFRFAYKFYSYYLSTKLAGRQRAVPIRPGFPVQLEFLTPDSPVGRKAWSVTEKILSDFAEAVRADGGRMMLAYSGYDIRNPSPETIRLTEEFQKATGYKIDLTLASKRLEAWAGSHSVPTLALDAGIEAYREREGLDAAGLGYTCDVHFNPEGHAVLADLLFGLVQEQVTAAVAAGGDGIPYAHVEHAR